MQHLIHAENRSGQSRIELFEARRILRFGKITNSCEWEHVQCTEGAVTAISWDRLLPDVLIDMRWLPPGVVRLILKNLLVINIFSASHLPKSLEYLNFEKSKMQGSVDLTKLPQPMTHFIANGNQLSGFADLTRLPPNIQRVEIRRNHIEKVFGTTDDLSASLEKAWFSQFYKKTRYFALDKKAKDPRITLWIVRKRETVTNYRPRLEDIEEEV